MNGISRRRAVLLQGAMTFALSALARAALGSEPVPTGAASERRWYEAALAMQRLAVANGDQAYGAVLVLDGAIVGHGPSRVVALGDSTAHAEREAIRDARHRLGRASLAGSVLYSTSRPCPACEAAAAEAGVARMIHGPQLRDAGAPRS
jgi:tRNA(Arg) A34 adenosine deaminase TadA